MEPSACHRGKDKMAKKKQKVVVWMSRDSKNHGFEFWQKMPQDRGGQYFDKAKKGSSRTNRTRLANPCKEFVSEIIQPIKLNKKGCYKLTITAERIE